MNKISAFDLTECFTTWDKNRDKFIYDIRKIYNSNRLTLVLGSGVSKAAGLPLWPDLVKALYNDLVLNKVVMDLPDWESLKLKTDELILQARYIKSGFGSPEAFFEAIERALYSKEVFMKNPLISSIGRLCVPTRFNYIKSVISYNFDDLLERKLNKYNVEHKSIFDSNVEFLESSLPIYHVHGYLPQHIKDFDNMNIVFSDDDYNRQSSSEMFSWSNIVQLTSFKDSGSFFVGTSFNDANLRRILEIVQLNFQGVVNYTVQKHSYDKNIHNQDIKSLLYLNDYLKESVLNELGVKVIWVDEYDEYYSIIDSIKGKS
ncbi:MAG: SIR2 family protein [Candidatus Muirbacterium halophilum]|nr:SIR2 family protein [Candidatus Muirbacterium halophilum]MCK9474352.1 SIR2 family protein [Candidatus Muirbacterium halophilum]